MKIFIFLVNAFLAISFTQAAALDNGSGNVEFLEELPVSKESVDTISIFGELTLPEILELILNENKPSEQDAGLEYNGDLDHYKGDIYRRNERDNQHSSHLASNDIHEIYELDKDKFEGSGDNAVDNDKGYSANVGDNGNNGDNGDNGDNEENDSENEKNDSNDENDSSDENDSNEDNDSSEENDSSNENDSSEENNSSEENDSSDEKDSNEDNDSSKENDSSD